MKKIYLTAVVFATLTTLFVSCSNEDVMQGSAPSAVVDGQSGRVVFSIKTGKDVIYTRSVSDAETAIKKMSVLFFDASGSLIPGIKRDYEETDLTEGKLSVSIPSDWMNKTGLTAYFITNVESTLFESVKNKEQLLNVLATTAPTTESVATNGIPMASAAVDVNTTAAMVSVEATLKRAMSSLYVQVNPVDGATVKAGDFTYTVKNVRKDKGYLFKDEVCEGEVAEAAAWAPVNNSNALELLGYMYQSDAFEIVVTPKADKPELGSSSRTVLVAADKAMKRNRKYILNVTPKVSESGTIDFTVTVQDWDATDGNFNVDWVERLNVNSSLPAGLEYQVDQFIAIGPANNSGLEDDFGLVRDFFNLSPDVNIVSIKTQGLQEEGCGLFLKDGKLVSSYNKVPLLNYTSGSLEITTEKAGIIASQKIGLSIVGALVRPKVGGSVVWDIDSRISKVFEYNARIVISNLIVIENNTVYAPENEVLELADGYKIIEVASNENFTEYSSQVYTESDMLTPIDGAFLNTGYDGSNKLIKFGYGGSESGWCYIYVKINNDENTSETVRKILIQVTLPV